MGAVYTLAAVPASFALCSECLAKYRALRLDTEARYSLNIMPLGTLVWSDELVLVRVCLSLLDYFGVLR